MINALGQRTIFQGHQSSITNQFSILIGGSFVVRQFFHSFAALARVRAGAKREPGRAKHEEDERGLKPRDYILD